MQYNISKDEYKALLYSYWQVLNNLDNPKVKGLTRKACFNFKSNLIKTANEIKNIDINDYIIIEKEI